MWGVSSTPDDKILVWDAGATQIVQLDPQLHRIQTIGRAGDGPGEFAYQRVPHGKWIATADSTFVVLGLTAGFFAEFSLQGSFRRNLTRAPPFPFSITDFALHDDRLYYAVDQVDGDTGATGARTLQTWRLEFELPHTLVHTAPMPTLPRWRGRPLTAGIGFDQATPLWAMEDSCVYLSDGGGTELVLVDLADGLADTLTLPEWDPPTPAAGGQRTCEAGTCLG